METKIEVFLPLFTILAQKFSIANVVSYLLSIFPLTIYTLNSLMYKQSFVIVYTV